MALNRDRHVRLYDLHSWLEIILGLFIFVVSFSGTIAVFGEELTPWENKNYRLSIAQNPISADVKLQEFITALESRGKIIDLRFVFPHTEQPFYQAYGVALSEDKKRVDYHQEWDSNTGQELAQRGHGLTHWIVDFHRNLMLPRTLGRLLAGLAGIAMLVLTLTGILIHGKIMRDFFTLRLTRSQRLKWQDSHKVIGIFGLPFFIVISFTGAVLGIVSVLSQIIVVISFQGDVDALLKKVLGEPSPADGVVAQMISMDELAKRSHPDTGEHPHFVFLQNYGDSAADFELFYDNQTAILMYDTVHISGVTGKAYDGGPPHAESMTPAVRATSMMVPLHYGTYGGKILKWIYFVLGLGLCTMIATGLMLWVERRQYGYEGKKSERFYSGMSKLNIAICLGFPLGTIALFYVDKLYMGLEASRIVWTGWIYFIVPVLVLLAAALGKDQYKTVKQGFILGGVLLLGLPVLNMLKTGATMWASSGVGQTYSNLTDWAFIGMGLACLFTAGKLPTARNPDMDRDKRDRDKRDRDKTVLS